MLIPLVQLQLGRQDSLDVKFHSREVQYRFSRLNGTRLSQATGLHSQEEGRCSPPSPSNPPVAIEICYTVIPDGSGRAQNQVFVASLATPNPTYLAISPGS